MCQITDTLLELTLEIVNVFRIYLHQAYKISTQWFHLGAKKLKDDYVEAFGHHLK